MKKSLLWVVVLLLSISMIAAFSFVGCKAKAAPAEEAAATETTAAATETTAAGAIPTVTLLLQTMYAPITEDLIRDQVSNWAEEKGVNAVVDFVEDTNLESIITAEDQAGEGHDIVALRDYVSWIFENILTDQSSTVTEIEKTLGDVEPFGEQAALVNGIWRGIPWYHDTQPMIYRKDYIEAVGYTTEDMNHMTTDEFLVLAQKLYESGSGHLVGISLGQIPDANGSVGSIMWAFGSYALGANNEVIIDSPETRQALEYVKKLQPYMPPEVTSWGPADNNEFILSGEGALTFNPPSIYAVAQEENLPFKDQVYCSPNIFGPNGSYNFIGGWTFGIPEYAVNKELAADLVEYLLQKENIYEFIKESGGFNVQIYKGLDDYSLWTDTPGLAGIFAGGDHFEMFGWPGPDAPGSAAAAKIQVSYTMPVMFEKVLSGESIDSAVSWAADQCQGFVNESK
jgi:ABC-type glycerol-3-phosphate transport system substrate-binding protein